MTPHMQNPASTLTQNHKNKATSIRLPWSGPAIPAARQHEYFG